MSQHNLNIFHAAEDLLYALDWQQHLQDGGGSGDPQKAVADVTAADGRLRDALQARDGTRPAGQLGRRAVRSIRSNALSLVSVNEPAADDVSSDESAAMAAGRVQGEAYRDRMLRERGIQPPAPAVAASRGDADEDPAAREGRLAGERWKREQLAARGIID